jgi:hypothetical protein
MYSPIFFLLAQLSEFISGSTAADLIDNKNSVYSDKTQLRHIRCLNDGTVICRPFLDSSSTLERFDGDGCADGENRIGNNTWASLGACKLNLYTGVTCYMLDPAEPYYTTYTNGESCTTSNDLVLNAAIADTAENALTATANYKYEEDPQLRHQRCNHAGVPVVSFKGL